MTSTQNNQIFGRYRILEQIGMGGMAVVYKAYDDQTGKHVAVKILRSDHLTRDLAEKSIHRFARETRTLSQLSHPNIIKILDFGDVRGHPFLVMEIMPGGTLKQRMPGSPIPWRQAAQYLLPVASALEFAHQHGIIHRDVKPSNILINALGQPILSDFGIVKFLGDDTTKDLTTTGIMVGTPEYMSPEQAMGEPFDHRVDVYSLGIVFYEMITGHKPFVADTPVAVLVKQASEQLPPPTRFAPGLPRDVESVLYQALEKKPEARFATMGAFRVALEKIIENTVSTPTLSVPQNDETLDAKEPIAPSAVAANDTSDSGISSNAEESPAPSSSGDAKPSSRSISPRRKFEWTRFRGFFATALLLVMASVGAIWIRGWDVFTPSPQPTASSIQDTPTPLLTSSTSPSQTPNPTATLPVTFTPTLFIPQPTMIPVSKWIELATGISQISSWKTGMGVKKVGLDWSISNSKELSISQYQLASYNTEIGEVIVTSPCTNSVIEYSRSGSFLMTGGCDKSQSGSVVVWDRLGGTSQKVIGSQNDGLSDAVLSPDGNMVVTSGLVNNQINLWNIEDGSKTLTIQTPDDVQDLDFSPDGKLIASAHPYNIAVLWDAQTGEEVWTLKKNATAGSGGILARPALGGGYYGAIAVKFSPDGKQIAIGYRDGAIVLWDVSTGKSIRSIQAHEGGAFALSFTNDGQVLASGGEDMLVKLWKVSDGSFLAERKGHRDMVLSVSFSPDNSLLASADFSGSVIIWNVSETEGQPTYTPTP
jgi:eukaryotic-like serine/threonine-protein kinase